MPIRYTLGLLLLVTGWSTAAVAQSKPPLDTEAQAAEILAQGRAYAQLLRANAATVARSKEPGIMVFSRRNGPHIQSLVFATTPAQEPTILRTFTYNDSLRLVREETAPRALRPDEALLAGICFNMRATARLMPGVLAPDFWVLIEEDGDKLIGYMVPQQLDPEVVMLGADCRITYSATGAFKTLELLHNNPIPVTAAEAETGHSHANRNSDFMSPLDVATALSYPYPLAWQRHIAISGKYVSELDVPAGRLRILPRKAYEAETGRKLR